MNSLEQLLDNFLSLLFTPLKIVGIRKCSRCTVRIRTAQIMMIVTVPIHFVPAVRRQRAKWDFVANPGKKELIKQKLPYIRPIKGIVREDIVYIDRHLSENKERAG